MEAKIIKSVAIVENVEPKVQGVIYSFERETVWMYSSMEESTVANGGGQDT